MSEESLEKKNSYLEPSFFARVASLFKEGAANLIRYSGVHNQKQSEIVPNFDQTNNEVVISGKTNSFVILGSDRDGGVGSGYGGSGDTGCASIDLVAGLMGARPVSKLNGIQIPAGKDFEYDAARVYISQKSDLDKYFGLPNIDINLGGITLPVQRSTEKSGVGIKADCLRFVARDNIVIATTNLGTLASGVEVEPNGIDIIAGAHFNNELKTSLQPMVKGNNLAAALDRLTNKIIEIQNTIIVIKERQQKINLFLQEHQHAMRSTSFTAKATTQAGNLKESIIQLNAEYNSHTADLIKDGIDMQDWRARYLNVASTEYINSLYNRVN